jgi:hypothetical protein
VKARKGAVGEAVHAGIEAYEASLTAATKSNGKSLKA